MATSVFCIVASEAQAERIVGDLKAAGFSNNDISALFPDKGSTRDFAHEPKTKAPEGAATGAVTGGLLGGTLGGLAGALIGLDVPEYEAKRYEGKVRDGRILMSVHAGDRAQRNRAKEIFERNGAEDISTAGEKAA